MSAKANSVTTAAKAADRAVPHNDGSQGGTFAEKSLDLGGRAFVVRVQGFENGAFVSVSEDRARIGSITASLVPHAGAAPATVSVTPAPTPDVAFFVKMAAEQVSSRTCGISVVSVHIRGGLEDPSVSKALLGQIMEMISHERENESGSR